MKKHLRWLMAAALGLGISLTGVSTAFAANLTWSADQTVDLSSPDINLTILSGSEATSLVVNAGSLDLVVADGDIFTVTSASRRLTVTGATSASVNTECASGVSTIIVTGGASGETLTIVPEDVACGATSGGGGGGGGSSTPPSTTPPGTTPPGTTPPPSIPLPEGAHSAGSVVKTSDGTVWFITLEGTRRPFTSAGAFLSYGFLSFSQVVDANSADLTLPVGSFIAPRDGSLFCATETRGTDVKGECSLITGGTKAAFISGSVFTGLGFSFKNVQNGDSSFLNKTSNIASSTEAHRSGVLVNNSNTIQAVGSASLVGIPSMDVFNSWGYNLSHVVKANSADKLLPQSGVMVSRVPGQLNP